MRELGGTTAARGIVVAMLSVGVTAGSVALSSMQRTLAQIAALTPAQTIAYRFPSNWHTAPAAQPPTVQTSTVQAHSANAAAATRPANNPFALREGDRAVVASLFGPQPTFGLASASSRPVILPDNSNAFADPSADSSALRRPPASDDVTVVRQQADKSPTDKPKAASPAREVKQSNNVFNDAQIASIKSRLKLTADQQRHWPGIEAALRNITYKKDSARGGKNAAVDPNSPAVQALKSAAMPLVFTFSEEQKNEVRQLARLMGLEQVASSL